MDGLGDTLIEPDGACHHLAASLGDSAQRVAIAGTGPLSASAICRATSGSFSGQAFARRVSVAVNASEPTRGEDATAFSAAAPRSLSSSLRRSGQEDLFDEGA